MTSKRWLEAEFEKAVKMLSGGYRPEEIGKVLGRSANAVRMKLVGRGYSSSKVVDTAADESPVEVSPIVSPTTREEAEELVEQREQRTAERRARQEAVEQVLADRLVDTFRDVVATCAIPPAIVAPAIDRQLDTPCSAVAVIGDLHVGKVIDPAETEGRAIYNPAVTVARLHQLEQEIIRLISSGPVVEELVVLLLGDVVEGALFHGNEREETILVSKQFSLAVSLLVQFLTRLCAAAPALRIYGLPGNHGRWMGQRKAPTVGRVSNLDSLVYIATQMVTQAAGIDRMQWDLRDASRQQVEVQNTLIHLLHGDEIRGGEFAIGGLKKEAYHSILRGAETGRFPDLWVCGDKHQTLQLPMAGGSCLVNGSLVGEDVYGQRFSPTVPSQTLLWICPERGRFLQSDIRVEATRLEGPLPYELSLELQNLIRRYQ